MCTAIAAAYRREKRAIGSEPEIWYATASLSVEYLRPTPIDTLVHLSGKVTAQEDRATTVQCILEAAGKERAHASVRTTRVSAEWRHGTKRSSGV